MRLEFSEVEAAAKAAFNVWMGAPELAWAERAWGLLETQGLADYDDEFDRHKVAFRFLVLGGIYRDFCAVYWEEPTDRLYWDWAESLDLSPLILGQLYGQLADEPMTEEVTEALSALVENERRTVVHALLEGFGGDVKLYESLARSREPRNTSPDDDHAEDPWEPTFANSAGYEWVSGGCQSRFENG